jgi:hypothetical protein
MVKTRKTRIKFQSRPLPPGSRKCHPRIKSVNGKCLPKSVLGQIRRSRAGGRGRASGPVVNERQLVEQSNLSDSEKQRILRTYFRPKMPEGWKADPDMWLNSDDIQHVMKQYEEAYPAFYFLGVVPIDFSAPDPYVKGVRKCMNPQFCSIDIKEMAARGIKYIGAVFNLDPHFKGGSHWVACCINIAKNGIYYFDSYGVPPPEQVAVFMKSFILQNPSFKLSYNGNRFQYGNSECGMYSCFFLIKMIMGESFAHFCHNPVSDKWMLEFRKVLFDGDA